MKLKIFRRQPEPSANPKSGIGTTKFSKSHIGPKTQKTNLESEAAEKSKAS